MFDEETGSDLELIHGDLDQALEIVSDTLENIAMSREA